MEHHSSKKNKYSVAWFKLAECISRKEKERALAVYRLLSHSIGDEALAVHLEGDILLSFNDMVAITKYKKAVEMYQKQKRLAPAIGICEHIVLLHSQDTWALHRLSELYHAMGIQSKAHATKQRLEKLKS